MNALWRRLAFRRGPVHNVLSRKILRESKHMFGQLIAIALVIAAGVMVLVISVSTRQSIEQSQQNFYQQYHFADVFAEVTRAPDDLLRTIRQLPGVNVAETRIRAGARFQLDDFAEPIQGEIISLPDRSPELLNRLHYLVGHAPQLGSQLEVVVSAPFAQAHQLNVGDTVAAVLNGRLQRLTISGVALSPEYIYQLSPNSILPDFERFGVFWMNRQALAAAFDMDGAFNSLSVTVQRNADVNDVRLQLDEILQRYGSRGSYDRHEQISHRFLSEELKQLRVMAVVLPTIFIGVAAFLLHVLLTRVIQTQKQSIALLKAFGYSSWHIIGHYLQLTAIILLLGIGGGIALGLFVAEPMAHMYAMYFHFPEFLFALQRDALIAAIFITCVVGFLATLRATAHAAKMAPAEAMRPPTPASFQRTWLDHPRIAHWWQQPTRIMLRNIRRHPWRAGVSVIGIGLSGGLLLLGSYQFNAIDHMLDQQYRQHYRMDLEVTFNQDRPHHSLTTLRAIPGVHYVEGFRQVPVLLSHERKQWRLALTGLPPESKLRQIGQDPQPLPSAGVVLSRYLADDLQLSPGDTVAVQILDDRQQSLTLTVANVIDEPMGLGLYMTVDHLNQLLFADQTVSGAWLLVEDGLQAQVFKQLQAMPAVASIGQISRAEEDIRTYINNTVLGVMTVMFLLAGSMTFAVVYNNARIMFAERARELASLRVLGFKKSEIAYILFGELGLLIVVAIPFAWAIGVTFAWLLTTAMSMDLFRIPFILSSTSFAISALGVLAAATLSILLMLRRVWQLDMIQALKTE